MPTPSSGTSERLNVPLAEIAPDFGALQGQEAVEGAFRVLRVRREIMSRVRDQRRAEGRQMQREADVEALLERLVNKHGLPAHRQRHLQGRIEEARADAEYYQELRTQLDLEIAVYERALGG